MVRAVEAPVVTPDGDQTAAGAATVGERPATKAPIARRGNGIGAAPEAAGPRWQVQARVQAPAQPHVRAATVRRDRPAVGRTQRISPGPRYPMLPDGHAADADGAAAAQTRTLRPPTESKPAGAPGQTV